ncbi:MAG: class I SAM-dependent methyltransferase [Aquisalinus sp.]|nr:class I SAM-dependent methyltransferase [Aquisalinus sp.]
MTESTYQKDESGKEIALETRASEADRLSSPSVARNRDAILEIFRQYMPDMGAFLEVGSGTGEHAAHIAGSLPELTWFPSDPDATSRASITAWAEHLDLANVHTPLDLDVTLDRWFEGRDIPKPLIGMMSVNMIHIAPFAAAEGLFAGAGALLQEDGRLFLYGPFLRNGKTASSNLAFDESLKSRDPRWGVRDLDREIMPLAEAANLTLHKVVEMPANNLSVIFRKS